MTIPELEFDIKTRYKGIPQRFLTLELGEQRFRELFNEVYPKRKADLRLPERFIALKEVKVVYLPDARKRDEVLRIDDEYFEWEQEEKDKLLYPNGRPPDIDISVLEELVKQSEQPPPTPREKPRPMFKPVALAIVIIVLVGWLGSKALELLK